MNFTGKGSRGSSSTVQMDRGECLKGDPQVGHVKEWWCWGGGRWTIINTKTADLIQSVQILWMEAGFFDERALPRHVGPPWGRCRSLLASSSADSGIRETPVRHVSTPLTKSNFLLCRPHPGRAELEKDFYRS